MVVTVEVLNEHEQLTYWNLLETYARAGRKKIVHLARLRKELDAAGVDAPAKEEVLSKEELRLEAVRGLEPTPDDVRELLSPE